MHKTTELLPPFLEGVAPGALLRLMERHLAVGLKAVRLSALRLYRRRQERQRMRTAFAEMRKLDDHLLRDLGFEPDAIRAVESDVLDDPRHDRARFAQSYYDFLR